MPRELTWEARSAEARRGSLGGYSGAVNLPASLVLACSWSTARTTGFLAGDARRAQEQGGTEAPRRPERAVVDDAEGQRGGGRSGKRSLTSSSINYSSRRQYERLLLRRASRTADDGGGYQRFWAEREAAV
jgi:hypothetical protein